MADEPTPKEKVKVSKPRIKLTTKTAKVDVPLATEKEPTAKPASPKPADIMPAAIEKEPTAKPMAMPTASMAKPTASMAKPQASMAKPTIRNEHNSIGKKNRPFVANKSDIKAVSDKCHQRIARRRVGVRS